jgi:hypothetical protein
VRPPSPPSLLGRADRGRDGAWRHPSLRTGQAGFPHHMWYTTFDALCGQLCYVVQRRKDRPFIGIFASPTPHNILQMKIVAGLPSRALSRYVQNLIPLSPGCPRAMPAGRWLRSEGLFYPISKARACLARLSCATQASCFWSLACWSEKDALGLHVPKSPVAPSVGREVTGGEVAHKP